MDTPAVPPKSADVVVVGAGIVGLASALELARRGRQVVVVERGPIEGGCAVGSAGHLVPSHVIPLAAPGALADAAGGLLRRDGAVSVTWSAAPSFWRWIARFVRSCTARSAASAAPALGELARLSGEMWEAWLADSGDAVCDDGLLDVYSDPRAFDRAVTHAEELRRSGVSVDVVDADKTLAMEPALIEPLAGGILLVGDRSVHPGAVLAGLIRRVQGAGAALVPHTELIGFTTEHDRVSVVRTTRGDVVASAVVLAAGAWTGRVARLLGERVPMLPGRGLCLTVDRPAVGPGRALLLGEHHVAVNPIGDELRLSAWFQLNNFDTTPDSAPIARLEAFARSRLRLDSHLTVRRWFAGLRPVTPDGVPMIGWSRHWRNLAIAAGHAMTGLTLGPGTGRIVAQLVCDEPLDVAIDRFSPRRFG